jgi:hypothetical protein
MFRVPRAQTAALTQSPPDAGTTHLVRTSASCAVMCAGGYLFECVFVIQSAVAQGMVDLLHFLVEVLSRTLRP